MEHIKKLIGQKIYLSPLQAEDAEQLCRWRNDLSLTQQLGSPTQLSTIESEEERIRQYNSGEEHHYGIFSLEDDTMLGYCGIRDFNRLYQSARVGIFIGDTKHQGKGYGTEAMRLLVGFGFDYLNMHSISLSVLDFDCTGSGMTGSRWRFWSSGGENGTRNRIAEENPQHESVHFLQAIKRPYRKDGL